MIGIVIMQLYFMVILYFLLRRNFLRSCQQYNYLLGVGDIVGLLGRAGLG